MVITSIWFSNSLGWPLPLENGFLSLFLSLWGNMMISCHGQFQRWPRSKFVTNWTLSRPGARQLSLRSYPDQHRLTSLLFQQFDISTSSHIRNFSMRLMATCIMTLLIYRFLFLTPQYYLPSLLFFFLFRRDPQSFSTPSQWGELSR